MDLILTPSGQAALAVPGALPAGRRELRLYRGRVVLFIDGRPVADVNDVADPVLNVLARQPTVALLEIPDAEKPPVRVTSLAAVADARAGHDAPRVAVSATPFTDIDFRNAVIAPLSRREHDPLAGEIRRRRLAFALQISTGVGAVMVAKSAAVAATAFLGAPALLGTVAGIAAAAAASQTVSYAFRRYAAHQNDLPSPVFWDKKRLATSFAFGLLGGVGLFVADGLLFSESAQAAEMDVPPAPVPTAPENPLARVREMIGAMSNPDPKLLEILTAAESGNAQATKDMGFVLFNERLGLPGDKTLAVALLQDAAEKGNAQAVRDLAWINQSSYAPMAPAAPVAVVAPAPVTAPVAEAIEVIDVTPPTMTDDLAAVRTIFESNGVNGAAAQDALARAMNGSAQGLKDVAHHLLNDIGGHRDLAVSLLQQAAQDGNAQALRALADLGVDTAAPVTIVTESVAPAVEVTEPPVTQALAAESQEVGKCEVMADPATGGLKFNFTNFPETVSGGQHITCIADFQKEPVRISSVEGSQPVAAAKFIERIALPYALDQFDKLKFVMR